MTEKNLFIYWLKKRLDAQELPGAYAHRLMMHTNREMPKLFPEDSRKAAVLLLLYPYQHTYKIVLIERSKNGGHHSGQIAFPGGKTEESDMSLWDTAIRESKEEVNLNEPVDCIGAISPLYIPVSKFVLYPFIGFINHAPALQPSDSEVANIIETDLATLFPNKSDKKIPIGTNLYVHSKVYNLNNGLFIWGATAMVLSELEVLLDEFKKV